MDKQKILWTASSVSLHPRLLESLKNLGCEILMGDGARDVPSEAIEKLLPKVWVTDVGGKPSEFIRLLEDISVKFPSISVLVFSAKPTVEEAVKVIRAGASEYMACSIEPERLLGAIERCVIHGRCKKRSKGSTIRRSIEPGEIVACDEAMKKVLEFARRAAERDATVLLEGESGSGKEIVARFIHQNSARRDGPLIAINCAALPENLLESELFGHERGAFTGATARKQGKFELADGGTLLLDEISEMAPAIQAKLLRALQERVIDKVGGRYPVEVDVRVIATTNRDLEKEVRNGNFRLDLYYRLNVIPLRIPPLRSRKADIIPLAELFLARQAARYGGSLKQLRPDARVFLEKYHWPGNVRELENLMERVSIFVDSDLVGQKDLERLIDLGSVNNEKVLTDANVVTLKEMEKKMIMNALKSNNGNRTHAAKVLGISVRTLRNKLKEYKAEMKL
ncbi:MAG: hypothetical protein DRH15_02650 [Deltaproteobacteria bacterium]|nr:MAG: hypothetical protein DRH15_02650 [Deltaproteobacteria bacterium]